MRDIVDHHDRTAIPSAGGGPKGAGTVTEVGLRYLLAEYAMAVRLSEQRWEQLRSELIQKAAAGFRG